MATIVTVLEIACVDAAEYEGVTALVAERKGPERLTDEVDENALVVRVTTTRTWDYQTGKIK
jgi:hypothetical protein